MSLETATYISDLDQANPAGPDRLANGDDHLRMIKRVLQATFPNITGPVTVDQDFLNTTILANLVPYGVITMFYGAAAPTGWALCQGQVVAKSDGSGNVTVPDMRDRVPVGTSATHVQLSTFGQTSNTVSAAAGGAHSHTGSTAADGAHSHVLTVAGHALTISELPAHSHDLTGNPGGSAGSNFETGIGGATSALASSSVGGGASHTHGATADTFAAHTHAVTVDAIAGHSHDVTVDVTQPSLALHFIMKI